MSISVLDRELYDVKLAGQLLRVPESTLWWWLEGRAPNYPPVIRPEATGSKAVTWGEFVEARYLLAYRRDLRVSLQELRRFIAVVRDELGVPYPLAHERPWVGEGRRILRHAQETSDLPAELWAMWGASSGQYLLTAPAQSFLERVDFEGDEAVRVLPAGRESPVVIDPRIRWGSPTVRGIPTEAIAEQVGAGDPIEMIAEDFGLAVAEVAAILTYESGAAAAA